MAKLFKVASMDVSGFATLVFSVTTDFCGAATTVATGCGSLGFAVAIGATSAAEATSTFDAWASLASV